MLLGRSDDKFGYPGEVFLLELDVTEGIIGVCIESGGDEDELGSEPVQGREPVTFDGLAETGAAGACRKWRVDDVGALQVKVAMGVMWVLEAGSDEDLRGVLENINRAVSMVHVEIQDSDPLDILMSKGGGGAHGDIVVKAESHAGVMLCMVAGRPGAGKNPPGLPGEDEVDRFFDGTGGELGGREGAWCEMSVGIDHREA